MYDNSGLRTHRPGSDTRRDRLRDFSGEVLPVVVIDQKRLQVPVPGVSLYGANVTTGKVKSLRDGCVSETVRSGSYTGLVPKFAHQTIDRRPCQTLALACPVEVDEQRTRFSASELQPCSESAYSGFWQRQSDLLTPGDPCREL